MNKKNRIISKHLHLSEDVCKLLKLKKNDLRRSERSIIDELVRNYLQDGGPNGQ